ncbi:MAG: alkaline phosphatase family protein [Candidatus Saccharicenans sp.]|jgi:predicted AlkP superfamily phosphohydrolase/phosphomutase|nr:alkaline phosphatase family protein [Candidatus Saccharicenans sp.]MDH7574295.1 alkaline phosphatase family protein [Candidatus Saccharicenans sp.]
MKAASGENSYPNRRPGPVLNYRLFFFLLLSLTVSAAAYIGPGAGFAFLSSFLVFFLTFFLAFFSLLSWPFRLLLRLLRGQKAYRHSRVDRVIILGFDGMDPVLAEKFMAEGKLPNLSRLKKEGTYRPLQTTTPAISPVAWSSFMTGCEPSKHNIFDFLSRNPKNYLPDLSSARIGPPRRFIPLGRYRIPLGRPEIKLLRRSQPFWKILGQQGIFSTVLRVPITFPPEKFAGHLLSGMCLPDLKGSQGTFLFYTSNPARLEKKEGGESQLVTVEGQVVRTYLGGPENSLLKKPEEIRLPMTIKLNYEQDSALVEVSGQRFELKKGVFSPWVRLSFPAGPGMKIRGIARFYLLNLKPHFELYVTPLNIDPEKPALPISHPFIYAPYLARLFGSYVTLGEANDTWALNEGVLPEKAFLELAYSFHEDWEKIFFNGLKKTRRGLLACVFETTDSIQHMFWRYLDKSHPAYQPTARLEDGSRVLEELYQKMDTLVGRVLNSLDDKSCLFVMSDHGFKAFRRGVNLNSWLYLNGYLHLKEGASESEEWFRQVDWSRTRAYALGLAGIYLNLRGREAQGIVEPGEESRRLKQELMEKLSGLKDPEKGSVAINRLIDSEKIYHGPYRDNAPDLIVAYNQGYRASWDSVVGKVNRTVIEDNRKAWSADHCLDPALVPGVLFSNLKLDAREASIMDIAPTVLQLFGVPLPAYLDGRSLLPEDSGKIKKENGENVQKKAGSDVRKKK